MNKSQEIKSIIAQRQPLAQKLGDIESRLSSLYGLIQSLAQERDRRTEGIVIGTNQRRLSLLM
ncbi:MULTISPECIES: hypothetical protein [Planktothricoides]|uniref:Uncharacterized protein n=2 Tax=Planktothricoides raciborskii TaxID=132608 RepID=A0AAU8JLW5_9CYAN|nr:MULTISPECIES: hypothetical protein [Planktothricoides]KOR37843.1 hypothetical protein AM228_05190 [Planktothricoides sp. SR001]MBD2543620.1 hypothetical protein [Planktothricoides raciborskii FACHB-1370]MBD2581309.1 hypothetical protein [Planktothricoides raciborskii FACHB-1261]